MNTWTIAVFEFKRYFKWKQEIISVALMLFGFGFSMAWPYLKSALDKDYQVAVVGASLMPKLEGFQFSEISPQTKLVAMEALGESWHAIVTVEKKPGQEQERVHITFKEKASWQAKLKSNLQSWQQQREIANLPLSASQRKQISELPEIEVLTLKPEKDDRDARGQNLVSGVLLFLLTIGIFSGFGHLFTGITSEKQNRVTEQLLTLITPTQWMEGKILGISLFCLKTMLSLGLIFFVFMQGMAAVNEKADFALPVTAFELVSALLFVVLGMLLVNSFMAGFAATIDDPNHSSRGIMMFLPTIPVGLAYSGLDNAEGLMMQLLSLFPLTSFAAMPLRMAQTAVPMWEWTLSLVLLVACMWWFKSAATRVFSLGIRMYGKEPSWKQLLETFLFPVKHQ